MSASPVDWIERLIELIRWLRGPQRLPVFARIVVPSIVLLYWMSGGDVFSGRSNISEPISAVKFANSTDSTGVFRSDEATLLIIEPEKRSYKVLFDKIPRSVWTTLSIEEYRLNRDRIDIGVSNNALSEMFVEMPLSGVSVPLGIIVEGESVSTLHINGDKRAVFPNLQLSTQSSDTLVMWGFIASVFSLGVTAAGSGLPRARPD